MHLVIEKDQIRKGYCLKVFMYLKDLKVFQKAPLCNA